MLSITCAIPNQNQLDEKKILRNDLLLLLQKTPVENTNRFTIVNQIVASYQEQEENAELILFLTDYIKKYPEDNFNAYWLLLIAYMYQKEGALPIAQLYFEQIIKNYQDMSVEGTSIHMLCLQNLVQLDTVSENRVEYYNQLIVYFPKQINKTELYMRMAIEYEKMGEWYEALRSYHLFLAQPDAAQIQISGVPDAYNKAKKLIAFNYSPKDWTFESLEALETAIKTAISNYQYTKLDKYRAKVNFFAMSWKQEADDTNSQVTFSMKDYGYGNRIRYSDHLDESSNPNEAYLKSWGWSSYIDTWYFYFRKVNFPLDPEIHGRWEWAGIYYGEKL